jgi:hypothetical protein
MNSTYTTLSSVRAAQEPGIGPIKLLLPTILIRLTRVS